MLFVEMNLICFIFTPVFLHNLLSIVVLNYRFIVCDFSKNIARHKNEKFKRIFHLCLYKIIVMGSCFYLFYV